MVARTKLIHMLFLADIITPKHKPLCYISTQNFSICFTAHRVRRQDLTKVWTHAEYHSAWQKYFLENHRSHEALKDNSRNTREERRPQRMDIVEEMPRVALEVADRVPVSDEQCLDCATIRVSEWEESTLKTQSD